MSSDTDSQRQERVKRKIAASQQRLDRDSPIPPLPPIQKGARDALSVIGKHPLLGVAAGVGAGLAIGALLPRKVIGKTRSGDKLLGALAMAGEIGLALAQKRMDRADDAAGKAGVKLARQAIKLAKRRG